MKRFRTGGYFFLPPFFFVTFFFAVFFFAAMFPSVVESGLNQLREEYIPQIDRATRGLDFFRDGCLTDDDVPMGLERSR